MRPSEARKHLAHMLGILERKEAELQDRLGDAVPRSTRVYDKKTIRALRVVLSKDSK